MQHRFTSTASQLVACASRSRLRPVVSLSDAARSAPDAAVENKSRTERSCTITQGFVVCRQAIARELRGFVKAQRAQQQQGINTKLQCTAERAKTAPQSGRVPSRFLCFSLCSKGSHSWRCSRVLRGLTIRSSGATTAWHTGHQALGLRPILRLLSSAPRRRRPLSSNVRPRNKQLRQLMQPNPIAELHGASRSRLFPSRVAAQPFASSRNREAIRQSLEVALQLSGCASEPPASLTRSALRL